LTKEGRISEREGILGMGNERRGALGAIFAYKRKEVMGRIFLVGYMGVGKSTVGRMLAREMGFGFIDLDKYIEKREGRTIARLFKEKGEGGFREVERQMLGEVCGLDEVVVATGGGTPCYYNNMEEMKGAGKTVYLRASVEELAGRIEMSRNVRPVVAGKRGGELREFIGGSLRQREVYYMQASLIWDVPALGTQEDIRELAGGLAGELGKGGD
jgi:shikimate kinase